MNSKLQIVLMSRSPQLSVVAATNQLMEDAVDDNDKAYILAAIKIQGIQSLAVCSSVLTHGFTART